jgi:hypothetical protein
VRRDVGPAARDAVTYRQGEGGGIVLVSVALTQRERREDRLSVPLESFLILDEVTTDGRMCYLLSMERR